MANNGLLGLMQGQEINEFQDKAYSNRDYNYAIAGLLQGLSLDGRGHGSDIGKLPNHPTFSNESAYDGLLLANGQRANGGVWNTGNKNYTPSNFQLSNMNQGDVNRLQKYFNENEAAAGYSLNIPIPNKQPDSEYKAPFK